MKKLNNKGYMLVEIIVASVIAFSVAYYLINLTYKFKDKNMDVYESTALSSNKIIITKNIMNDLVGKYCQITTDKENVGNTIDIECKDETATINKRIKIENNTIEYGDLDSGTISTEQKNYYKKKLPSYIEIGSPEINNINNNKTIINIPISSIYDKKTYNIKIIVSNIDPVISKRKANLIKIINNNDNEDILIKCIDNINNCKTKIQEYFGNNYTIDEVTIKDNKLIISFTDGKQSPITINLPNPSFIHYAGMGPFSIDYYYKWDAFYNNGNSHASSGTTWKATGSGPNLTISNATWGADYLTFNGTSSGVMSSIGLTSAYGSVTLAATIMIDNNSTGEAVQVIIGNPESGGFDLVINDKRPALYLAQGTSTASYKTLIGNERLEPGKKYHIVGTYDGSNMKLYQNGKLIKQTPVTGTIKATTDSTKVALGCNPSGSTCDENYFKGIIYNAAFIVPSTPTATNAAVTPNQIKLDAGKNVYEGHKYGTLPTPVRAGYTFDGWYTSPDFTTKITDDTIVTAAEDHTIYAKWK